MKKAQKNRLYKDVQFLTDLRPFRNYQNLESLEKIVDYLKGTFSSFGYACEEQSWQVEGTAYKNILCAYQPEKTKRLVVGAHYDVCGEQPGADDNASAVAGLLETARLFAENQPKIDYRVDFVAYCLEEPPYFGSEFMGSYIHAKSLHDAQADVVGMVCYEMIGYFSDEPGSQPFPSPELAKQYPDTANFIIVVGIQQCTAFNERIFNLMKGTADINVERIDFPDGNGLAGLSDQRNYWKFGYQALMINDTSFIRNPNYHLPSDTIDTLDFDKMTEVVNASYGAVSRFL